MMQFTAEEWSWIIEALMEYAGAYRLAAKAGDSAPMAAVFSRQADRVQRLAERLEAERNAGSLIRLKLTLENEP